MKKDFLNNVIESEIKIAWSHWNRLGAMGYEKIIMCSTDPEALILLTSIVGKNDERLITAMNSWLAKYESLVSIERLKRYIKELNVHENQTYVFDVLNDTVSHYVPKRWLSIAKLLNTKITQDSINIEAASKKLALHERIMQKNLQLMLRSEYGAGTKADVIYFFLVVFEQKKGAVFFPSMPQISKMLHYNHSSIYRTIQQLAQDRGLLEKQQGKDVYSINFRALAKTFKEPYRWQTEILYYVDWLSIIKMALLTEQLNDQLQQTNDESITKSRLSDYIKECEQLMDESGIYHSDFFKGLQNVPLMTVDITAIQDNTIQMMNNIYLQLTSKS